ncbi:hypothetical protein RUM44_009372 [Polyplax serrata]|uniref:Secreted protein n=1 Tax=Polyplax serrata TaxID=468196 RepID=A0ABR1ASI5_POLSC
MMAQVLSLLVQVLVPSRAFAPEFHPVDLLLSVFPYRPNLGLGGSTFEKGLTDVRKRKEAKPGQANRAGTFDIDFRMIGKSFIESLDLSTHLL